MVQGSYDPANDYKSYLKMSFSSDNQFVLNSGIRENRSVIGEMPEKEVWVLDYKIVDKDNNDKSDKFSFDLGDFSYNPTDDTQNKSTSNINITKDSSGANRLEFTVSNTSYTKETFKKNAKICLLIKPTTAPASALVAVILRSSSAIYLTPRSPS